MKKKIYPTPFPPDEGEGKRLNDALKRAVREAIGYDETTDTSDPADLVGKEIAEANVAAAEQALEN